MIDFVYQFFNSPYVATILVIVAVILVVTLLPRSLRKLKK